MLSDGLNKNQPPDEHVDALQSNPATLGPMMGSTQWRNRAERGLPPPEKTLRQSDAFIQHLTDRCSADVASKPQPVVSGPLVSSSTSHAPGPASDEIGRASCRERG